MVYRNLWLEFWYEALSSPLGIVITVADVEKAKQSLYRARQQAADPALTGLQIRTSPLLPKEELWILKDGPQV